MYRKKDIVVLTMDLVPTFGMIVDIIVTGMDNILLICEVLQTEIFKHHVHAYKALKPSIPEYWIGRQRDLFNHTVLTAYTCAGQPGFFSITLKYLLVDDV